MNRVLCAFKKRSGALLVNLGWEDEKDLLLDRQLTFSALCAQYVVVDRFRQSNSYDERLTFNFSFNRLSSLFDLICIQTLYRLNGDGQSAHLSIRGKGSDSDSDSAGQRICI